MEQTIVLITGANSGIGFELAAQLSRDPSRHVLLGSRSLEKGQAAVREIESRNLPGKIELLQVDVTKQDSIASAAEHVQSTHGRIDVLVNNAAIASSAVGGTLFEQLDQCFRTNAVGPAAVVEAFAPLLRNSTSSTPRIINVTSGAGSISLRLDATSPTYEHKVVAYRASKAALNMVTACQSVEYGPLGWKVFAFCPGFTASNLSQSNKEEFGAKPTSEGARPIVGIINGGRDGEHGGFLNTDGHYDW